MKWGSKEQVDRGFSLIFDIFNAFFQLADFG